MDRLLALLSLVRHSGRKYGLAMEFMTKMILALTRKHDMVHACTGGPRVHSFSIEHGTSRAVNVGLGYRFN